MPVACPTDLAWSIGHTSAVLSVAASPDGAFVVSGSRDKTLRVWEAPSATDPDLNLGFLIVYVCTLKARASD
jgi:WD40 repeat protein